jgi:acyl-CoA synthetase (AMP-forming)/AMP-acid ligase II
MPSTIPEMLSESVRRFGPTLAVLDGETRWSYEDLQREVRLVAAGLAETGVGPGDTVAVWAPNIAEWVVVALATHTLGAVLVPVNTRFKGTEAAHVLRRSRARVLCTVRGFLGVDYPALLQAAGEPTPALETVVLLRGDATGGERSWAALRAVGAEHLADFEPPIVSPDAVSDILFTSGTTGLAKGVMTSHAQTLRVFAAWSETVGLTAGDRYLVVAPFFHCFGYKAGFLAALMCGASVHPQAVFDVDAVLERVAAERITVLPGPPTLYQSILASPRRGDLDLSSLRLAVTGAANVPVELIRRMRASLTFRTVVTAYGLTESSGVVSICRPEDSAETIAETSGRAIDGVEMKVVGPDGAALPPGQAGEILVRGYNVMLGYLDDPEATAAAIDADGWLHTGDVGVLDAAGYVRITDRLKDMFIVGGFNAYPAEIEAVLSQHEAVERVAVVGVADERLGEVGVAFIVRRAGHAPDTQALHDWSRERLANYKVPRRFLFVDALPMNASGKVLKHPLRAAAQAP